MMSEKQEPISLRCKECGNSKRFVEIMDYAVNLVDGHFNHVRLLEASADYYLCDECGERVPFSLEEDS